LNENPQRGDVSGNATTRKEERMADHGKALKGKPAFWWAKEREPWKRIRAVFDRTHGIAPAPLPLTEEKTDGAESPRTEQKTVYRDPEAKHRLQRS
jgi:hypothetical protein